MRLLVEKCVPLVVFLGPHNFFVLGISELENKVDSLEAELGTRIGMPE